MHAASQYVTMVARSRGFVALHSTWQIRSRHCKGLGKAKGSSLSSLIIDHWVHIAAVTRTFATQHTRPIRLRDKCNDSFNTYVITANNIIRKESAQNACLVP